MSGILWKQTRRLLSIYYLELRGFYWRLPWNKTKIFTIKIYPGIKIRYKRQGDIGELLYKYEFLVNRKKSFEYPTLDKFVSLVKPGDIILDIGANTGLYSIFFSKLISEEGKVFAFEPDSGTFKILEENLIINSCVNVVPLNFALSDKEAAIEMVSELSNNAHLKTGDAFRYIKEVNEVHSANGSSVMKSVRLDDIQEIQQQPGINFLKVDVEGAELLVFKGAEITLKKFKPAILFELNGQLTSRFDYKPIDILLFLHDLGYTLEEYDDQQWIATPLH